MKRLMPLLLGLMILASCRTVSFTDVAGTRLDSIPSQLHGRYRLVEKNRDSREHGPHFLEISSGKISFSDSMLSPLSLDSSLVFSSTKRYWYVNIPVTVDGKTGYDVVPLHRHDGKIFFWILGTALEDKISKHFYKVKGESGNVALYAMNSETFDWWCGKHLKTRKAEKLIKVNPVK